MAKRFFFPGKVVTSEWLNKSQFYGPGNPGVIFTANPANDWEYPLLKTTSIDLPDFSSTFVRVNGNVTVNGIKTFTNSPIVPTVSSLITTGQQAANIDYVNTAIVDSLTNSGFVTLGTVQTITGIKTLDDVRVPATPLFANSPVAKDYLDNFYVDIQNAQSITGEKTFTSIKVPSTPADNNDPISKLYLESNYVDISNPQTITGVKTFNDISVPLTPNSAADPVSFTYWATNTVDLTNNQAIGGVKTFAQSPVVPNATLPNQAVNFSQLAGTFITTGADYLLLPGGVKVCWGVETGLVSGAIISFPPQVNFTSLPTILLTPDVPTSPYQRASLDITNSSTTQFTVNGVTFNYGGYAGYGGDGAYGVSVIPTGVKVHWLAIGL